MTVKEYNRSVEEYADSVYRFIRGNLRDEERSNDIVQDSYEKLWRHVAEIDYTVVKSWLFSTAYNTMIDIIRKEKRMTSIEPAHEYELIYDSQYTGLNDILNEALLRLPEQQKISVMLRDYEGYTYKEISDITGFSEAQVKINIYRGRIALKNFIGKIENCAITMQIDRANYEIWIIDWLDGNLNSRQIEQLMLFLDQNQDLREELNDLTSSIPVSSDLSYPNKEHLKKSPSDISAYQFEYLCAAFLENDLSVSQQAELKDIVNTSADRKRTFEQMLKTKIVPHKITWQHKHTLLKRTPVQKIIRLSVTGISVAAAIALIIIINSVFPPAAFLKQNSPSQNIMSDSNLKESQSVPATEEKTGDSMPVPAVKKKEIRSASHYKEDNVITNHDRTGAFSDVSPVRITDEQEMTVSKVPVYTHIDLRKVTVSNTLIASNLQLNIPESEEERSQVGRFISKTFREKLLKEKTPPDSPIKGYEIAEAGVAGLNKLLGWEMALVMKNDENGQPKSVSFSSQILKFSAPVKKKESQP